MQRLSALLVGFLLVPALACSESSTDPVRPSDCTARLAGWCWTLLGLDGQWVTAVASTDWGLYAGTVDAGVVRRDPATGRWRSLGLNRSIVSSLLFVPGSPARLLVGIEPRGEEQTPAAVFASEDQGRTWRPADGGLAVRHDLRAWAYELAADPGDPKRIYMSTNYPILRSNDGGESWTFVWLTDEDLGGGQFRTILVSPQRDGRIWAGGQTGFFAGIILSSSNWGANWSVTYPTPRMDNQIFSLATDPALPRRLIAGAEAGALISDDAGESWRYAMRTRAPGAVTGVTSVGQVLYAASSEELPPTMNQDTPPTELGFYRSTDGGATWEAMPVPAGISGAEVLVSDSVGRLLIGTRSGLWRLSPGEDY